MSSKLNRNGRPARRSSSSLSKAAPSFEFKNRTEPLRSAQCFPNRVRLSTLSAEPARLIRQRYRRRPAQVLPSAPDDHSELPVWQRPCSSRSPPEVRTSGPRPRRASSRSEASPWDEWPTFCLRPPTPALRQCPNSGLRFARWPFLLPRPNGRRLTGPVRA